MGGFPSSDILYTDDYLFYNCGTGNASDSVNNTTSFRLQSLHLLFEQQASQFPDSPAAHFGSRLAVATIYSACALANHPKKISIALGMLGLTVLSQQGRWTITYSAD